MRLRLPSTSQVLLAAVLLIQIPLWFGQGGWLHVWRLERQLDQQLQKAEQQKQVIQELEAELKDLRSGVTAAEERARYEMGMMKPNERFVQIVTPSASPQNPAESPAQNPPASTR